MTDIDEVLTPEQLTETVESFVSGNRAPWVERRLAVAYCTAIPVLDAEIERLRAEVSECVKRNDQVVAQRNMELAERRKAESWSRLWKKGFKLMRAACKINFRNAARAEAALAELKKVAGEMAARRVHG